MQTQRKTQLKIVLILLSLLLPVFSSAEELSFKAIDSKIAEYRRWLDEVGTNGVRYWVKLDSTHRPHRLYIGDGFKEASPEQQENFVEIFSRFLAGHPEKNMLIDLYDPKTNKMIGEYGFGGFKLF